MSIYSFELGSLRAASAAEAIDACYGDDFYTSPKPYISDVLLDGEVVIACQNNQNVDELLISHLQSENYKESIKFVSLKKQEFVVIIQAPTRDAAISEFESRYASIDYFIPELIWHYGALDEVFDDDDYWSKDFPLNTYSISFDHYIRLGGWRLSGAWLISGKQVYKIAGSDDLGQSIRLDNEEGNARFDDAGACHLILDAMVAIDELLYANIGKGMYQTDIISCSDFGVLIINIPDQNKLEMDMLTRLPQLITHALLNNRIFQSVSWQTNWENDERRVDYVAVVLGDIDADVESLVAVSKSQTGYKVAKKSDNVILSHW